MHINTRYLCLALIASLAGCTATQATRTIATAQQVISDGQLVCKVGPTALAMFDSSGAEILAKGGTKQAVDTVCGIVDGIAVALPNVSVQPAGLVVTLPPSVTIPLKN